MQLFSKPLSSTDVRKRLAIPTKALTFLLPNGGGHSVELKVLHGATVWPIVCTTRRKGYKKPVFSKGWKQFVIRNKLKVGDIVSLFMDEEDETGLPCSYFKIEAKRANVKDSGEAHCNYVPAGDVTNVSAGNHSGEASCNFSYSAATTYKANLAAGYVPAGKYSGEATNGSNYSSAISHKANFASGYGPAGAGIHQFGSEDEKGEKFASFKLLGVNIIGNRTPAARSHGSTGKNSCFRAKEEREFDGLNLNLTLAPPTVTCS